VTLSDVAVAYLPMACIIIRCLLLDALLGGRDRIRKRSRDLDKEMSNEKGRSHRGFDQADSEQTGQYPGRKRSAQYSSLIGDEWSPYHERVVRYGLTFPSGRLRQATLLMF
jgi:hypothetical protein